jgi:uncharacterized membrane protein
MDTGWMDRKATRDNLRPLVQAGVISPGELEQALRIAGIIPDGKAWSRFLNTLFLILGSVFLAAGVIFFFAYNWASMHRLLKLAVVQAALILTVFVASYHGFEKLAGKASLLVSCILVGALFALFGQIYQTGADAYELFLAWSAFIAGWVVISNFAALWLLLLILLEAALFLYWAQVVEMSWFIYRSPLIYELIFGLNVLALALWELCSSRGVSWLRGRWIPRLVASSGLFSLMIPLVILIVDQNAFYPGSKYNAFLPLLYVASVGFILWFYQSRIFDLYMIAVSLLSLIVLISIFFARQIGSNYGGFLFLSLLIVALSAGTAAWLRSMARKQSSEAL